MYIYIYICIDLLTAAYSTRPDGPVPAAPGPPMQSGCDGESCGCCVMMIIIAMTVTIVMKVIIVITEEEEQWAADYSDI